MRSLLIPLAFLLTASGVARSADAIPTAVLAKLKDATVFVKIEAGPLRGTGTGFLMQVRGETGLIVTNEHVVSPPKGIRLPTPKVDVVFHSGRKNEMTVAAEVVAKDADRDLAILRIRNVKGLPKPLDLTQRVKLAETMSVYALGFPFGRALAATKGNPAITIGTATISSLRNDEFGTLKVVQIDGNVNPGNSGGPVVDAQGRLIGVTVAKIRNSNIGFAIPAAHLSEMLKGRIASMGTRVLSVEKGVAKIKLTMTFIDPLDNVKKAFVRVAPAGDLKRPIKIRANGTWPEMPAKVTATLTVKDGKAVGELELKSSSNGKVQYLMQAVYVRADDSMIHTSPGKHGIDFGATVITRPMTDPNRKPVVPVEIRPSDTSERKTVKLPALIGDVVVGGGGRYLVLHLPKIRKIAVFDVSAAKVTRYLSIAEDNVCIAAGMDVLMVALPNKRLLQRWSLTTGEREFTSPQRFPGRIEQITMGSASNGPLLVRRADKRDESVALFLDPLTCTEIRYEWIAQRTPKRVPHVNSPFVRASADGSFFAWRASVGGEPHAVNLVRLQGGQAKVHRPWLKSSLILPDHDGRYFYTYPAIYNAESQLIHPKQEQRQWYKPFVPARNRGYFLQLDASGDKGIGDVSFFITGQQQPFAKMEKIEGVWGERIAYGKAKDRLAHDKRVHFVPEANLLVTVPSSNDRLMLYPFDPDEALKKSGLDYLFVTSPPTASAMKSGPFTYALAVKSKKGGLTFRVESGPKGATITKTGELRWDVPADYDAVETTIIVSVRDADGRECFHNLTVTVK